MTEHGTLGSRHRRLSPASLAVPVGGRQLIVRLRPVVWAVGVLVTASAVGGGPALRVRRRRHLGRLPDLYEPTWTVPGKSSSGVLQGSATFLALIGPRGARDPSDGRHDQCLGTHMSVSVETLAILSREVREGSGHAVIGSAR